MIIKFKRAAGFPNNEVVGAEPNSEGAGLETGACPNNPVLGREGAVVVLWPNNP